MLCRQQHRTNGYISELNFDLTLIYFHYLGPNNEGCQNIVDSNVTITNDAIEVFNNTDIENENSTLTTTESNVVSFETSTENITLPIDDDNSTTVEMENNVSTMVEDMTSTSVFVDTTMEEVLESSTAESVETTTMKVETTTAVRSNLCFDSEFECCPDGKTPAQVIDLSREKISHFPRIY